MCKLFMKFFSSFSVSIMSFFWAVKIPKMNKFFIHSNGRSPFICFFSPMSSFNSSYVSWIAASIASIFMVASFTHVTPAIICFIAIYMIYSMDRPFANYNKPCNAVRIIMASVYINLLVSCAWINIARWFSGKSGIESFVFIKIKSFLPQQFTSLWVVIQNRLDVLGGKIVNWFSHGNSPLLVIRNADAVDAARRSAFMPLIMEGVNG